MKTIYLDAGDDIVSICDHLAWSDARQLLLVLPEEGRVLQGGLALVRLRRQADRLQLDVGLVTADSSTMRQAIALGIPAFPTVDEGQHSRRGWWRGRQRRERVGLPGSGEIGQPAVRQELAAAARAVIDNHFERNQLGGWRFWLRRYVSTVFFFLFLSLLFVAFIYVVPTATITLKPEVLPVTASRELVADPALEEVDFAAASVQARLLVVEASWKTQVPTTGSVEVPSTFARGRVLFTNLTEDELLIPAGTRLSASAGARPSFRTVEAVSLVGVSGGTAEVEVVALELGPQANLNADELDTIEPPFAGQLTVRNPAAFSGGGVSAVPAVAEADRVRVRSQVLQFLQALALSEMEARLTEREFLARDSLRVVNVLAERYSHEVGNQTDRLTLEMRAELQGTAVDTTRAATLVYEALAAQVEDGFALVPDSIDYQDGEALAADERGRVSLVMTGEGVMAADLDLSEPLMAVTGQEVEIAVAYLYRELPLREAPSVRVSPAWMKKMPYLTSRIEVEVAP
ncbi:MAG: baseplate J/gp47 family protein [Anaerolineae bacterium]